MASTTEIVVSAIMIFMLFLIIIIPLIIVIKKGKTIRLKVVFHLGMDIADTVKRMESIGCMVIGIERKPCDGEIVFHIEAPCKMNGYCSAMSELMFFDRVKYLSEEALTDPSEE